MSASKKATKELTERDKEVLLQKIQKDLVPNWIVRFSKKHASRVYYFNKANGNRTWEHPGFLEGEDDKCGKKKLTKKRKSDEYLPARRKSAHNGRNSSHNTEVTNLKNAEGKELEPHKKSKRRRRTIQKKKSLVGSDVKMATGPSLTNNRLEPNTSSHCDHQDKNLTHIEIESNSIPLKDIEMKDLSSPMSCNAFANDTTETKHKEEGMPEKQIVAILDTNILLNKTSLGQLKSLFEKASVGKNCLKTQFIVPWVVLQELDKLKKCKPSARQAISFLNRQFQEDQSNICGQTIFEAASVIDGLSVETNDDRILQCCFFVRQSPSNKLPILVTRDKNLMNKALTNGFRCYEAVSNLENFMRHKVTKVKDIALHQAKAKIEQGELNISQSDGNNNHVGTSHLKTQQKACTIHLSPLIKKSRHHLQSALSYILQKEMKAAFDDLWLDVILIKPPWSLSDVLSCIHKHWLAVFSMLGVDNLVQVHVEQLRNLNHSFVPSSAVDMLCITNWFKSALNLILGISQQGKYGNPVKDDLEALKTIYESLKSYSNIAWTGQAEELIELSENRGSNPIEDHSDRRPGEAQTEESIEMTSTESKVDCSNFWIALNQIWTSIISHCGMLFQSLQFIPKKIENAPEVRQAMDATFEKVPEKLVSAQALPLVAELVRSLQVSLEKLLILFDQNHSGSTEAFTDLLETLWTTTQAFSVNYNLCGLMTSHQEICDIIVSSAEMVQRLRYGFQQLCVVSDFLKECGSAITCNLAMLPC